MAKFVAVYTGHSAQTAYVYGDTRDELLHYARNQTGFGMWNLARICVEDGHYPNIWVENTGWTPEADQYFPPEAK